MATARYLKEGSHHHVYFRGVDNTDVFRDDSDRGGFVELWRKNIEGLEIATLSIALLGTHGHLFVRANIDVVSRVMQRVLGPYALRFNRRWGRCGDLFESRFKSKPVRSSHHARTLVRYVLRNPVEAGLCSVDELPNYRWCNYGDLLGMTRRFDAQGTQEVLSLFAVAVPAARARLRDFVVRQSIRESVTHRCYRVCAKHGLTGRELRGEGRGPAVAAGRRELARELACELSWTSTKIARYLKCSSRSVYRLLASSDDSEELSASVIDNEELSATVSVE